MKTSEFESYFGRVTMTLNKVDRQALERLVQVIMDCRERNNMIFIFGNGGSAATASHVTGDFIKGISYELDKRFKVMCLSDNIPGTSAVSNDLSYDEVFVEPLKSYLSENDVVIGISGSGNSENVVKAMEYARSRGAYCVAFCGYTGGKIKSIADLVIHVPIDDMEVTEDIHLVIFHAIKQSIIHRIKGARYSMGEKYDNRIR